MMSLPEATEHHITPSTTVDGVVASATDNEIVADDFGQRVVASSSDEVFEPRDDITLNVAALAVEYRRQQ